MESGKGLHSALPHHKCELVGEENEKEENKKIGTDERKISQRKNDYPTESPNPFEMKKGN